MYFYAVDIFFQFVESGPGYADKVEELKVKPRV